MIFFKFYIKKNVEHGDYLFAITMEIHHAQIKWVPLSPIIPNNRNLPPTTYAPTESY